MMIDDGKLYQIDQDYLAQKPYGVAERHFKAALNSYAAKYDLVGEGNCRNGLGQVYLAQGREIDAWTEFWLGLLCHQAAHYPPGEAISLRGIGLILYNQGYLDKAESYFEEAQECRRVSAFNID